MKPDWDKLMTDYADSKTVLIADVDCTTEGKPLCDSNGVKGFPSIKYGDPSDLQDYQGGRDLASLTKFAKDLKPLCSPNNIDLCDEAQKEEIVKVQALSDEELDTEIAASDKKAKDAEDYFSAELEKLQATYKQLQDDKDAILAEVKDSGIGMYKSVRASRKGGKGKEEL